MPSIDIYALQSTHPFNFSPLVSTVDQFVTLFIQNNSALNEETCKKLIADISKNSTFWKRYLSGTTTLSNAFVWIQNWELVEELYFDKGYGAESILARLHITKYNVEALRKYLKTYFRGRTGEEIKKFKISSGINKGSDNIRNDLIGAEDEIIRLYKHEHMGADRIALLFGCSADLVRKILIENDEFNEINKQNVRKMGHVEQSMTRKSRTTAQKLETRKATKETRKKNNSSEIARVKYIETIRKKFNDPNITNVSQVHSIHEKQQRYRYYEYKFKTGETVNVQGYESKALVELEEKFLFNELCLRKSFWYLSQEDGLLHKYFADIFILPTSDIIEVKSKWTIVKYMLKNKSILQHMLTHNQSFSFWVFEENGDKTVIKTMEQFHRFLELTSNNQKIQQL